MKKYIINEEESNRILNLHFQEKQNKKLVTEQATEKDLQVYLDTKCITGGSVTSLSRTDGTEIFVIKKDSPSPSGKIYYFFPDFRYGYFENGKFVYSKDKWKCAKNPVEKYNLPSENLSQRAEEILADLRKSGWYPANEVDPKLRVNPKPISYFFPKDWNTFFKTDFDLFKKDSGIALPTTGDTALDSFSKDLDEKLTKEFCFDQIDKFYQGFYYNQKSTVSNQEIESRKTMVEHCIRKYPFNLDVYYKTKRKILELGGYRGKRTDGASEDSPYHIKLPKKYKP